MCAAGMADGEYSIGGLPVIVSEGAARLKSNGALAGSTLEVCTALKNVAAITGKPERETRPINVYVHYLIFSGIKPQIDDEP